MPRVGGEHVEVGDLDVDLRDVDLGDLDVGKIGDIELEDGAVRPGLRAGPARFGAGFRPGPVRFGAGFRPGPVRFGAGLVAGPLRFGAGFVGGPAGLIPGGGPRIGVGARLFGRVLGQPRGGEDQSGHDDETDHGFASCDCSTAFLSERTYAA